jgi:hypothetical protein
VLNRLRDYASRNQERFKHRAFDESPLLSGESICLKADCLYQLEQLEHELSGVARKRKRESCHFVYSSQGMKLFI